MNSISQSKILQEHWVERRADTINVKGKGVLEAWWLHPKSKEVASISSGADSNFEVLPAPAPPLGSENDTRTKQGRLVDWITELFIKRLETIVARQDPAKVGTCNPSSLIFRIPEGKTSLDEVAEVIKLPKFDAEAAKRAKKRGTVQISPEVVSQMREVVSALADMYQMNPFHSKKKSPGNHCRFSSCIIRCVCVCV
jgi:hypothetical protein